MDRVTRHLVFQQPQASHRHDSLAELRASNVWTPSPDRESKLEVVRSGSLYDLRAYKRERKPSKLYDDEEQDLHRVPPPNISPEKARELEDERKEVIRSQAMRKSSTIAERWSSMDELGSISSPNIDTEQINFSAARQQFLMLEKTNPGSFFSPGQQAISAGASSQSGTDKSVYQVYGVSSYKTPEKEEVYTPRKSHTERSHPIGKVNGTRVSNETPIEREIRMALEREENLWKERGIQRLTSSSELVEIQTKPVLNIHASPGPGRKGKDRGRASLYVQREIEQETKREEDLKRQGRLLGEAPPEKPTPLKRAEERRSWLKEFVVEQPSSPTEDSKAGRSIPSYTASIAHFQLSQPRFAASERSRELPSVSPHASASASKWGSEDSQGGKPPSSTQSPSSAAVLPREYLNLSFWKPKVSFVEDMGTQRREDGREEQYRLRTGKPQTSALIEEEIRSDLQREEELQEQRRRLMDTYGSAAPQEGSRSRHSSGKGAQGRRNYLVGWLSTETLVPTPSANTDQGPVWTCRDPSTDPLSKC
uniref:A-kinase anchor protein 2 C-terminal domain-containing protein n=1 Tax=Zonotrichia albicollis TaxID=44394 RepID=A0A8D2NCS0_ZONAL